MRVNVRGSSTLNTLEVETWVAYKHLWGQDMCVVCVGGCDYCIGSHLAELLKRETFNLYRSLKRRNIPIFHADDHLLKMLIKQNLVYSGSSSASLIRVQDVAGFVESVSAELKKKEARRKGASSAAVRARNKRRREDAAAGLSVLMEAAETAGKGPNNDQEDDDDDDDDDDRYNNDSDNYNAAVAVRVDMPPLSSNVHDASGAGGEDSSKNGNGNRPPLTRPTFSITLRRPPAAAAPPPPPPMTNTSAGSAPVFTSSNATLIPPPLKTDDSNNTFQNVHFCGDGESGALCSGSCVHCMAQASASN